MQLSSLLVVLPALPLVAAETVLGTYIFHRHGDRTTKSYSPVSLTPLGADQALASGLWYRHQYLSANASSRIPGMATDLPVLSQLSVTSPVDNVLQGSAQVFLMGLYPPAGSAASQTLADGSSVAMPLGGYQFIPVNAVSTAASSRGSEDDLWLQGGSGCGNAVASSNSYFHSSEYLAALKSTQTFYQSLLPVYNTTFPSATASFKNAYAIYDYIHVSEIHNASSTISSAGLLTNETLHQLQTRADQHEWGLAFNSSEQVRAISGSLLAAQIVQALNNTLAAPVGKTSAQKMTIQFGPYGTFMAFFGLAKAPAASPEFYGIVDYASSMVFELVTNASLDDSAAAVSPDKVSVRFRFANGTASNANPPRTFPLFGQTETTLPWSTFVSEMNKFAIGSNEAWCKACGPTGACAEIAQNGSSVSTAASTDGSSTGGISTPVAGVIGAVVTLAVILGLEGLIMAVAGLRLTKKGKKNDAVRKTSNSDNGSDA
ncbi:phosphoglycerate mutase-like protein [Lasiosphaeria ovina]|uniref:Phosphoglycerate mutase-like protein n=1 Tax=Lasiosphaeria ovina TaxID=92902 RepID=A0AAE0JSR4_9PEZI|nr:phosphoglycerate mutase-like protein [Lasiosphaeria ovina]